jgi:hypothetical protein
MANKYRIPDLSVDLIEKLNKEYPARCIKHNESAIDAHRYAGKRDLIENLLIHLKQAAAGTGVLDNVLSRIDGSN